LSRGFYKKIRNNLEKIRLYKGKIKKEGIDTFRFYAIQEDAKPF